MKAGDDRPMCAVHAELFQIFDPGGTYTAGPVCARIRDRGSGIGLNLARTDWRSRGKGKEWEIFVQEWAQSSADGRTITLVNHQVSPLLLHSNS